MKELFERFIHSKESSDNLAITTLESYKRIWKHFSPMFDNVRVQDVTPLMVDDYFNKKREDSKKKLEDNPKANILNSNSLRKHYDLMNQIITYGVKKDIIKINFMDKVDRPAYVEPEFDYYNHDEIRKLLALLTDYYFDLAIKIAIYLGLRLSEIMGLKWENVDLENGLININLSKIRLSLLLILVFCCYHALYLKI